MPSAPGVCQEVLGPGTQQTASLLFTHCHGVTQGCAAHTNSWTNNLALEKYITQGAGERTESRG